MTRVQIRNLIRKSLGETTAAFWTNDELNLWIEDACDDLAFRAKCIRDDGLMTPVVSTAEYTLSTYFPTAIAVLEVYYYQNATTWEKLDPTDRERLNLEHPGWMSAAAGTPSEYYWSREEDLLGFYVKPNSTNAGTNYAKVYYAKTHTDISAESVEPDIPLNLQPAIVEFVTARGFDTRGWGDKGNDRWQKYYSKIKDYQIERNREREDDEIISKNYRNI
jgi:hypothetical protein